MAQGCEGGRDHRFAQLARFQCRPSKPTEIMSILVHHAHVHTGNCLLEWEGEGAPPKPLLKDK